MAATVLVRLGLFVRKGIPVQLVPPFARRIGGSRLVLKALPAALLALTPDFPIRHNMWIQHWGLLPKGLELRCFPPARY